MRHSFNMPSWLLQVEILAFLQTGGVDLVAARKAELPRNDQRRPAFGESLQYHAVMRITNVFSQVMMANRARRDTTEAKPEAEADPEGKHEATPEPEAIPEPETKPEPAAKPEPKPAPEPEAKPERRPEPKSEPEPEPEHGPEAKSEPEPEPTPEANPEPEAEPRLITLIRSLT
jgi:outer membrane biosynthesis protein TonB